MGIWPIRSAVVIWTRSSTTWSSFGGTLIECEGLKKGVNVRCCRWSSPSAVNTSAWIAIIIWFVFPVFDTLFLTSQQDAEIASLMRSSGALELYDIAVKWVITSCIRSTVIQAWQTCCEQRLAYGGRLGVLASKFTFTIPHTLHWGQYTYSKVAISYAVESKDSVENYRGEESRDTHLGVLAALCKFSFSLLSYALALI